MAKSKVWHSTSKALVLFLLLAAPGLASCDGDTKKLDASLVAALQQAGFTGKIDQSLESRLGRPVNQKKADLGRLIFFDRLPALHEDASVKTAGNSCAGCHAPAFGFGDSESIAIGVDSNNTVGKGRAGIRNQRRTPVVLNTAFYPKLMWNGRFLAPSGDPFDNSQGFEMIFAPNDTDRFAANDPNVRVLLAAQGHIPGTELPEMAGFTGLSKSAFFSERFRAPPNSAKSFIAEGSDREGGRPYLLFPSRRGEDLLKASSDEVDPAIFDDGHGTEIPAPDGRNAAIRAEIVSRFNKSDNYRAKFAEVYPEVAAGKPITFAMIAEALSEFQISLTYADAPLDKFARGDHRAMTKDQKLGALVFFGKGQCSSCHAVKGKANEMFSDFESYNVGVPQIAPRYGKTTGNVPFRNENGDFVTTGLYDFGLEDITGNAADRFKFRTSPLRNLRLQPTYFHNGSFTTLRDALRHHLDPVAGLRSYDPAKAGVDADLRNVGSPDPVIARIHPSFQKGVKLTNAEFEQLLAFLELGLADPEATTDLFNGMIPSSVPSGISLQTFQR